jgi:elongation factor 1-gamma
VRSREGTDGHSFVNQEKLKSIFDNGNPELTQERTYQPPAKPAAAEKPKAAAPPAEKKEKAPKKKEVDEEEEEPLVPAEPKVKNPLDDLPKSAFNLEEWKRQYSNLDTRKEALPWFYEKFDREGFSIWRVDFKYNTELTQVFMSSNQVSPVTPATTASPHRLVITLPHLPTLPTLRSSRNVLTLQIGGFFNRLEASRKYLFGSMGVLGKANDSIISGAVICRGLDYKPVMDVAPDWESYEYKKIDLENADDKAFFEAAMAWDLIVDGKEWADGKNFK